MMWLRGRRFDNRALDGVLHAGAPRRAEMEAKWITKQIDVRPLTFRIAGDAREFEVDGPVSVDFTDDGLVNVTWSVRIKEPTPTQ